MTLNAVIKQSRTTPTKLLINQEAAVSRHRPNSVVALATAIRTRWVVAIPAKNSLCSVAMADFQGVGRHGVLCERSMFLA